MSEREIIGDEVREVTGTRSYRNWYIIVRILAFTVCEMGCHRNVLSRGVT